MKITILTATYNRGYIINKLYTSLTEQTCKNFEWIVIDDGSTDDTENIIKKFIEEKKVKIKYLKQKNGGKHRALNKGISMINTEMVFIVDSDDYLTNDAIETINRYYEKYKNNNGICGFSFLRCFPNHKIIGRQFAKNECIESYISCRINKNIVGDKAEVYFTKCLKEYPFLEIDNEKFLFEDYVWIQMGEKYKTVHINKAIYVGNYLEDGLTKNMMKVKLLSPKGMSARGQMLCSRKCNIWTRIKGMMIYIGYYKIAKENDIKKFKECRYKILFIIFYIPSLIYFIYLLKKKRGVI